MKLEKLYDELNEQLFDGQLYRIPVKYSKRMTRCAGVYTCKLRDNKVLDGTECIKIADRNFSEDVLKGILAHEMIHAYLAQSGFPREHHGYKFKKKMAEVQKRASFQISLKHNPQESEIKKSVPRYVIVFEKKDGNKSVAVFNKKISAPLTKIQEYAKGFFAYPHYVKADFGVSSKNTEFYPHKRSLRGPIYFVNNNYPVQLDTVLFSVER